MPALAYDDRKTAEAHEQTELRVRVPDERAGAIGDLKTGVAPFGALPIRCAVRGDHDFRRRCGLRIERALAYAPLREAFADDGIVDEFAEDGERAL